MQGLANVLDLSIGVNNAAQATGTVTGKRIHMAQYQTMDFVLIMGAASAGTDTIVLTLQEANALTGGTAQNLAAIGDVYYKSTAAALAGTEQWTFLDNRSASVKQATLSLTNALIPAANSAIVEFSVEADSLSAGFGWLLVNFSGLTSTNTRPGTLLYVGSGLKAMRAPELLANPNA